MAHEELKFKIDLKEKNDYQPILGSQDYGTFYMVYIRIIDYKSFTNDFGITQHNYTCDFKLQNFRGEVTMGFSNQTPSINFIENPEVNDGIDVVLNITVAPFSLNIELLNIVIETDKQIKQNMILETNFERKSPPADLYDPINPEKSKYLNPNRFIRDGEDFTEISTRKFGSDDSFPIPDSAGVRNGICLPNRSLII